jgi:hypothetical protein
MCDWSIRGYAETSQEHSVSSSNRVSYWKGLTLGNDHQSRSIGMLTVAVFGHGMAELGEDGLAALTTMVLTVNGESYRAV